MNTCPRCRRAYADGVRYCPVDGALVAAVVDPFLGKLLMGQFQLVSVAGRGAMGTVYRAEQVRMDRTVAVKVLRGDLLKDENAVQRFLREARASARLNHPNIVTVHLVGESDEGVPFIVMEYVEGMTLGALCESEAVIETRRALRIVKQIAGALVEAHAHGIVHRDLKADNILLTEKRHESDVVKVLDFGIAKLLSGEGGEIAALTRDGTIFGTPHYIAPEQAAGNDVDGRADLYSLGVILFRMTTGQLPFDGNSGMQVLMRHVREQPPRPRDLMPGISSSLEALILHALEKDRTHRIASAEQFMRDIDDVEGSLHLDAAQTLAGIPLPPRGDGKGTLPTALSGRAPSPAKAVVARAPSSSLKDDPTRTRAGEQGLDEWSDGAERAVLLDAEKNPEYESITGTRANDELRGASTAWKKRVAMVVALMLVVGGAFGAVRELAKRRPAVDATTETMVGPQKVDAPATNKIGPKLVEEHVASSGNYSLRFGFEKQPTAGDLNVLHVLLDGGNGVKVAGARLELAIRGSGEHEDVSDLHEAPPPQDGYVAEIAFRNPGRHQLRLTSDPPGGKRFVTTIALDVAPSVTAPPPRTELSPELPPTQRATSPIANPPSTPTLVETPPPVAAPELGTAGRVAARGRHEHEAKRDSNAEDPNALPVTVIPPSGGGGSTTVLPHALGPDGARSSRTSSARGIIPHAIPQTSTLVPGALPADSPLIVAPAGNNEPVSDDPYKLLDKH